MRQPWTEALINDPGQPSLSGEVLCAWWHGLAYDRASRATLRRSATVADAFAATAFLSLCAAMMRRFPHADAETLAERLAPISLAVAEIDRDDGRSPGTVFGSPGARGKALSEARLRLLAGSDETALFLRLLRSAIDQTGRSQSVLATAELVRRWQEPPHVRERARRRLLLDYVAVARADRDAA